MFACVIDLFAEHHKHEINLNRSTSKLDPGPSPIYLQLPVKS